MINQPYASPSFPGTPWGVTPYPTVPQPTPSNSFPLGYGLPLATTSTFPPPGDPPFMGPPTWMIPTTSTPTPFPANLMPLNTSAAPVTSPWVYPTPAPSTLLSPPPLPDLPTQGGTPTPSPSPVASQPPAPTPQPPAAENTPNYSIPNPMAWETRPNGLQLLDTRVGKGIEATAGKTVTVHYTGTLQSNGKKFDSSLDRDEPFTFNLGAGEVIPGWDEGVAGMKVGGKRTLIVPADMAYGPMGAPPDIPPNATLKFVVELLGVQ